LKFFDVRRASRYGGNIRAYVAKKGVRPINARVPELLALEEQKGLFNPETWALWRKKVEENRTALMTLAYSAKQRGEKFVAASCPGRGTVLLNHYGLDTTLLPYIAEIPTGLKIGRYMPGVHTPVVSNEILFKEQPEYVVILAWHYADYIIKDFRERGLRSKFVIPLPEVRIIE